jgi:hypothetical protein
MISFVFSNSFQQPDKENDFEIGTTKYTPGTYTTSLLHYATINNNTNPFILIS